MGDKSLSQYTTKLSSYSSEYGSINSVAYVVSNILGKSKVYPLYGDFTEACVLRTYGKWVCCFFVTSCHLLDTLLMRRPLLEFTSSHNMQWLEYVCCCQCADCCHCTSCCHYACCCHYANCCHYDSCCYCTGIIRRHKNCQDNFLFF